MNWPLAVTNWQRACPDCGYENGFHVSFHNNGNGGAPGSTSVLLICPSCSAVFDIGLHVALREPCARSLPGSYAR